MAGVADHVVREEAWVDFGPMDMLIETDILLEIKIQTIYDIVWHLITKVTHRCSVSWGWSRRTAIADLDLGRVVLGLNTVLKIYHYLIVPRCRIIDINLT